MKSHSLNGHRLVFTKGKHNLLHWIVVLIIRLTKFIIFVPLGLYLIAIGYSLSIKTIGRFIPDDLSSNIIIASDRLPFFEQILNLIFSQLGDWYLKASVWITMVIGLPLITVGFIVIATVFFDLYYALFVPEFHQTHCPFCKYPIKIRKKQ
ncbi:hypothetical protein ACFL0Y_00750 [Patescibacteria group bacterium]